MLKPVEIRASDGCYLIGAFTMVPAQQRRLYGASTNAARLFASRDAVGQLRRAWPQIGLGNDGTQGLADPALRSIFETAIRTSRLTILWIPRGAQGVVDFAAVKAAAPVPIPEAVGTGSRPPAPPHIATLTPGEKIRLTLDRALAYLDRDTRAGVVELVQALRELSVEQWTLIVGAFAIVFVPVVGEVVLGLMLAYAWFEVGYHGTLAVIKLTAACAAAADAKTDTDIDRAAQKMAAGLADLGKGMIAFLLARLQMRGVAGGSKGAGAGAEAEVAAGRTARVAEPPPMPKAAPKVQVGGERIGGAAKTTPIVEARGGTYVLRDADGAVVRSGRTKDLARRRAEHGRDPDLADYKFEIVHRTDDYAQQRGLEQVLYDKYNPALNKVRPISPSNKNIDSYTEAAQRYIREGGGP